MKSYHTDNGKGVDAFKLKRKILLYLSCPPC